mgnify:CR=1 FL=1
MKSNILLDTGPLVAIVNRREAFHQWATQTTTNLSYPFFTCEAVITEACFLLQDVYGSEDAIMALIERGTIKIDFRLNDEVKVIRELM